MRNPELSQKEAFFREVKPLFDTHIYLEDGALTFNPNYMTISKSQILRQRLKDDLEFRDKWGVNYSSVFYDDLYSRLTNENNIIMRLYGDPKGGKSYGSLYLVYLEREFLGFDYQNFFSRLEASSWLALNSYDSHKNEKLITKVTLNIDEEDITYGYGSKQQETHFQSMAEFLRKALINIHMCNPSVQLQGNSTDAEVQLEAIGYTNPDENGVTYEKFMAYYLTNKRTRAYRCMGYVLTKKPPDNYVKPYEIQKNKFLKDFQSNKSTKSVTTEKLLERVYGNMNKEGTLRDMKDGILLGRDNDVKILLQKEFDYFNLPIGQGRQLIEQFIWKYFKGEREQNWEMKKMRLTKEKDKMMFQRKDINQVKEDKPNNE